MEREREETQRERKKRGEKQIRRNREKERKLKENENVRETNLFVIESEKTIPCFINKKNDWNPAIKNVIITSISKKS